MTCPKLISKDDLLHIYAEVSASRYPAFLPQPMLGADEPEAIGILYEFCKLVLTQEERSIAVRERLKRRVKRGEVVR